MRLHQSYSMYVPSQKGFLFLSFPSLPFDRVLTLSSTFATDHERPRSTHQIDCP